ncbi:MAG TPA: acyl-CoA desaturase [Myxococcales bacterium]
MSKARVHFPAAGPFHSDLKGRVEAYFAHRSADGGWRMRVKTAVMLSWMAATWAVAMFAPVGGMVAASLAVSIGLAMAGVGFCVMHDANHGSYSRSRDVNRVLGFTLDLLGASSHLWRQKHNILHHTYTNIEGLDDDIEAGTPYLRFAPWQRRMFFHRFQHLYVFLLYGFFPLKWFFVDDFRGFVTGRVGSQSFPPARGKALLTALVGKAAFFAWAFVVPALLHPTWWLVPLWLVASFTLGNVLGWVFQLAHCLDGAEFVGVEPGQVMREDWAVHQVRTTVDFARGNRLLSWYLGGLNFQVEHHLFPRVCHVHYPALSRIVEQTCADHHVRYRAEPTLRKALAANCRWLREMGRPLASALCSVERPAPRAHAGLSP